MKRSSGDVKLKKSHRLGRLSRNGDPVSLGESTWETLEAAIARHDKAQAIRLLQYLEEGETAPRHHFLFDWIYGIQTYVVENFGEVTYEEMFRAEEWNGLTGGRLSGYPLTMLGDAEAMVKRQAELMRGHWAPRGSIVIIEEEDRYVMNFFPCNSGGRMLRSGMTEGAWNLAVTKSRQPWSWNKVGKPVYCGHCALAKGIMPTEIRGYPVRIHDNPGEGFNPDRNHPNDPCRMIFYKHPESIPEKYFKVLGLKKDPSRFQVVPSEATSMQTSTFTL